MTVDAPVALKMNLFLIQFLVYLCDGAALNGADWKTILGLVPNAESWIPMEWLRMSLDFLSTLAWPVVVLWVAFLFRNRLDGLIGRVSKVSAAGVSAEFEQEIANLNRSVHATSDEAARSHGDDSPSTGGVLQHSANATNGLPRSFLIEAREVADTSPTAAAVLGRIALELALDEREFPGSDPKRPKRPSQHLDDLRPHIGDTVYRQSMSALNLANKAAHGMAADLTAFGANQLLDTIEVLIKEISTT